MLCDIGHDMAYERLERPELFDEKSTWRLAGNRDIYNSCRHSERYRDLSTRTICSDPQNLKAGHFAPGR